MIAQRQYLQDLHKNLPEPSLTSANAFIDYARSAEEEFQRGSLPPTDPQSVWSYPPPQAIAGRPGDLRVKYRIAGKDVQVPYGYPEESIFILTASYRDPEVASTVARAFARWVGGCSTVLCITVQYSTWGWTWDCAEVIDCMVALISSHCRAAHPERIFVGVYAQNEGGDLEPGDIIQALYSFFLLVTSFAIQREIPSAGSSMWAWCVPTILCAPGGWVSQWVGGLVVLRVH